MLFNYLLKYISITFVNSEKTSKSLQNAIICLYCNSEFIQLKKLSKMKKSLLLVLAIAATLFVTSCRNQSTEEAPAVEETPAVEEAPATEEVAPATEEAPMTEEADTTTAE